MNFPMISPQNLLQFVLSCIALSELSNAWSLVDIDEASLSPISVDLASNLMSHYSRDVSTNVSNHELPDDSSWQVGSVVDLMINHWALTNDSTYDERILTMLGRYVFDHSKNYITLLDFQDNNDLSLWTLAMMSAAEAHFPMVATQNQSWSTLAINGYDALRSQWDDQVCSGGIRQQRFPFNAGYGYKDTISNGNLFHLAARLAHHTQNETYAQQAVEILSWIENSALFEESGWTLYSGVTAYLDCNNATKTMRSYDYATMVVGMAYMYNYTHGDPNWDHRLTHLLQSALATFFRGNSSTTSILEEFCEPPRTCEEIEKTFKSFFVRWLSRTALLAPHLGQSIYPHLERLAAITISCLYKSDNTTCGIRGVVIDDQNLCGIAAQSYALATIDSLIVNDHWLVQGSPNSSSSHGSTNASNKTSEMENGIIPLNSSGLCLSSPRYEVMFTAFLAMIFRLLA